jgi:hypothetical protein
MLSLIFAILCDGWTVMDELSLSSIRVKLAMVLYACFDCKYEKHKIPHLLKICGGMPHAGVAHGVLRPNHERAAGSIASLVARQLEI